MKHNLFTKMAAVFTFIVFSSMAMAEGLADRKNDMSFGIDNYGQTEQDVIQQIHEQYGPTAAGPVAETAMVKRDQRARKDHKSWDDQSLEGLTAHQRKHLIFGSNM